MTCERCGIEEPECDDWVIAEGGLSYCGDCWHQYYDHDDDEDESDDE